MWTFLKNAIASVIKPNDNQEITGQVLQSTLYSIVNAIGENATFAGVATPTTAPGEPDGPVFYLAATPGSYVSFGSISLENGEIAALHNNSGSWVKSTITKTAGYYNPANIDSLLTPGTYFRKGTNYEGLLLVSQNSINYNRWQLMLEVNAQGLINFQSRKYDYASKTWDEWVPYSAELKATVQETLQSHDVPKLRPYANLYSTEKATVGKYLAANGSTSVNAIYAISDYIPFTSGMGTLSSWVNGSANNNGEGYIILYDADKNIVYTTTLTASGGKVNWVENTAYARFSIRDYANGEVQIVVGADKKPYSPYDGEFAQTNVNKQNEWTITGSVASGKYLNLPLSYIRKNNFVAATLTGPITNVRIGYGLQNAYQGWWVELTSTQVNIYQYISSATLKETFIDHGLNLSLATVHVAISTEGKTAKVIIVAGGKSFVKELKAWYGGGAPGVYNGGTTSINVTLTNCPRDIKSDIWLYGDSYFSYWQTDRWTYYLLDWGFKNVMLSHLPGINSPNMLPVFLNELTLRTPRYAVWCLGMNDNADTNEDTPNSAWLTAITKFISICEYKGITPILATIPCVPGKSHAGKNKWVQNSGYKYIDFAKAMGATSDSTWLSGYLSSDNIHPTAEGAVVLAAQAVVDFPQLTQL